MNEVRQAIDRLVVKTAVSVFGGCLGAQLLGFSVGYLIQHSWKTGCILALISAISFMTCLIAGIKIIK